MEPSANNPRIWLHSPGSQHQLWDISGPAVSLVRNWPQPPAGPPAPGPSGPYNQRTQDLAPPTGRLTPALRHLELLSQPSKDPAPITSTPTITLGHPGPDSRAMSGTNLPTNRLMLDLGPTGKQPLRQNTALLTIGPPVPQNVPGLHSQVPHNLAPPTSSKHPPHEAT